MNRFHDGSMDGLLMEEDKASIFLSTDGHEHFVLELENVERLKADEFREGSSIFDVLVRKGSELTCADVMDLYGFTDERKALVKLEQVLEQGFCIVEINPSYGVSCIALAGSIKLISKQEWLRQSLTKEA